MDHSHFLKRCRHLFGKLGSDNGFEFIPGVYNRTPVHDTSVAADDYVARIRIRNERINERLCIGGLNIVEMVFRKVLFDLAGRVVISAGFYYEYELILGLWLANSGLNRRGGEPALTASCKERAWSDSPARRAY